MLFNRFAAVLWTVVIVGCAPEPPSAESIPGELAKRIVSSVSTAETVTVVASSPTSSESPTDFAIKVADALAKQIAAGGFEPNSEPDVRVRHTRDEVSEDDSTDVTVYLQVNEHQLKSEFAPDRAAISKKFEADGWIYSRGSDNPFTIKAGFSTGENAHGPAPEDSKSVPTWESFGYPSDRDERLQVFAGECAELMLKTFHETTSRMSQEK